MLWACGLDCLAELGDGRSSIYADACVLADHGFSASSVAQLGKEHWTHVDQSHGGASNALADSTSQMSA